jgi:hypothetical protein
MKGRKAMFSSGQHGRRVEGDCRGGWPLDERADAIKNNLEETGSSGSEVIHRVIFWERGWGVCKLATS